jgi:hypothetical protein
MAETSVGHSGFDSSARARGWRAITLWAIIGAVVVFALLAAFLVVAARAGNATTFFASHGFGLINRETTTVTQRGDNYPGADVLPGGGATGNTAGTSGSAGGTLGSTSGGLSGGPQGATNGTTGPAAGAAQSSNTGGGPFGTAS